MFRDGITGVSSFTPINPDVPCFRFLGAEGSHTSALLCTPTSSCLSLLLIREGVETALVRWDGVGASVCPERAALLLASGRADTPFLPLDAAVTLPLLRREYFLGAGPLPLPELRQRERERDRERDRDS